MPNLLRIANLTSQEIRTIQMLASQAPVALGGTVGWSFEGNGIRTRTSFLRAFHDLGLQSIELPNLLKTGERVQDIAGYLDPFYNIYVIREANHARLEAFARASARPVVNGMSAKAHPCEVLADFCWLEQEVGPVTQLRIGLWGPPTNVLRSWHELAQALEVEIVHFCPVHYHAPAAHVRFLKDVDVEVDLIITDAWPEGFCDPAWTLTPEYLKAMGGPRLLPTPPFAIGNEVGFDPAAYGAFVGYDQKRYLLPVQRGVVVFALGDTA